MSPPEPGVLETVTGPDTLAAVRHLLEEFWSSHPAVPKAVRLSLATATAEIAANIVLHAGGGRPTRMRMALRSFPNEVRVTFTDDGLAADVDLQAVGLPDWPAERGRGLALAKALLGQLSYHRGGTGNQWTLVSKPFNWSAPWTDQD